MNIRLIILCARYKQEVVYGNAFLNGTEEERKETARTDEIFLQTSRGRSRRVIVSAFRLKTNLAINPSIIIVIMKIHGARTGGVPHGRACVRNKPLSRLRHRSVRDSNYYRRRHVSRGKCETSQLRSIRYLDGTHVRRRRLI